MAKKFGSGAAFKTSLEARLRKRAEELAVPFSTLQLKFVMERLLARLFRNPDPPWLLKSGFAMDLRFRPQARTTKDVDLAVATITVDVGAKLTAVLGVYFERGLMPASVSMMSSGVHSSSRTTWRLSF